MECLGASPIVKAFYADSVSVFVMADNGARFVLIGLVNGCEQNNEDGLKH
jgi:hypothetical protein